MTKKFKNVLLGVFSLAAVTTMGLSVAFSSNITAAAQETNVFEMVYGAGIRVSDPTGMRFKTKFSKNYYEELTADNTDTQMFVSVLPYADYIQYDKSEDLAVWLDSYYGAGKYINIAMDPEKFYQIAEDDCYYGNAVISNIYLNNYHREFVGVAYLRRGEAGNYTYEYTTKAITKEDNARSVFEVASKANMNEEDHAKYSDALEKFIKNGLYGAYGVKYDKNTGKYSLKGSTYTSIEEIETVVKLKDATLSVENAALGVGENKQLTPTLTYADGTAFDKDVFFTWSSSNPSVATVDENGKVTTLAEGVTTITVTGCGGLYSATCTVNVSKKAIVDTNLFLAKGDAGKDVANIGLAALDLSGKGIDLQKLEKVTIDGAATSAYTVNGNVITFNNPAPGTHAIVLETAAVKYTMDVCFYGHGISTLAELDAWRTSDIQAYTVLLKDIDAQAATLAATDVWHAGILDGLGHTVSNFTMNGGFVCAINGSGAIKNLQLVNFVQDCSSASSSNKFGVVCGENNNGTIENVLLKGKLVNVPGGDHYGLIESTAHKNSVLRNVFAELTSDGTGNHYTGPWWHDNGYTISNVAIVFNARSYNHDYTEDQIRVYGSMDAFAQSVDLSKWEGWTLKDGKFYMSEYANGVIVDTGKSFLVKSNGALNSSATGTAVVNLAELGIDLSKITSVLIDGETFSNFSFAGDTLTLNDAPGGEHVYTLMVGVNGYTVSGCVYANGISTLADLETWRTSDIAAYTVLLSDIDAQGATLAATDVWHCGILDGLGHTVSNFTMKGGFVHAVNGSGAIKNLQLVSFTQDCSAMNWDNKFGVVCTENNGGTIENVLLKGSLVNVPGEDHYGLIQSTAHKNSVLRNVFAELTSDGAKNHYTGPWWTEAPYTISNVAIVFNASAYNAEYTADQICSYGSMDAFVANVDLTKWEGWTLKDGKFYMSEYNDLFIKETNKSFRVKSNGSLNSSATGAATINLAELDLGISSVTSVLIDGEEFNNFSSNNGTLTLNDAPSGEHAYTLISDTVGYIVKGFIYANGISTLAELETWRTSDIQAYTVLLNDIDAQGQTLAATDVWHGGILDGLGHTVSNFTMNGGFVCAINGGGAIKNLQLVNFTQDCSSASSDNKFGVVCGENNNGTIENVLLKGKLVNVPGGDHYGLIESTAHKNSVLRNVFAELTSDGTGNHYTGPWWHDNGYTISNVAIVFNARSYNHDYTEDQIRVYGSMDAFAQNVDLSKWEGWTLKDGKFYMSEYANGVIVDTGKSFLVKSNGSLNSSATGTATINLADLGLNIPVVTSVLIDGNVFSNFSFAGDTLTLNDAPGGEHVYTLMAGVNGYMVSGCVYANGISTLADLETWRTSDIAAYTVLLSDIDAQGATLAATDVWHAGILDGLGYTVSNFTMKGSFVHAINGSGAIKNLQLVNFIQDCSAYAWENKMGVVCVENNGGAIENVLLKGNLVNVPNGDHYGLISSTAGNNSVQRNVFAELTSDGTGNHYTGPWYKDGNWTISNVAVVFNARSYNPGYTEDQIRFYGSMDEFAANVDLSKWEGWTLEDGKFYMSEYTEGVITDTGKSFLVKSNGGLNSSATGTAVVNIAELGIPTVTSILIDGNVFTNFSVGGGNLTLNNAPGGEHVYTLMAGVNGYIVSGCVYANGISTVEELEAWRLSNPLAYTVLLNDIDAQGATLAASDIWREGVFDGLGHTVSNFTMKGSFVHAINGSGAIKNLQLVNFVQDCSAYAWENKMGVVCVENNGGTIENVLLKGSLVNVPNGDHYGLISSTAGNNSVQRNVFAELTSDGAGNHYTGPWWKADNYTISNVAVVFNARSYNPGYTEDQIRFYGSMDEFAANVDISKWEGWTLEDGKFYMSEYGDFSITDTSKSFLVKSSAGQWDKTTKEATVNLKELGLNLPLVTSVLIDGEIFTNFSSSNGYLTLNDAPGGDHVYTLMFGSVGYRLNGCVYANGISTVAQLEEWRTTESFWYTVLLNDIDYNGQTLVTNGDSDNAIGLLDGRGYTISNFTHTTGFVNKVFGSGSVIKNVSFKGVKHDVSKADNKSYGLFGADVQGTIENIYLEIATINGSGEHYGVLTAQVSGVAKNVIVNITSSYAEVAHYIMGANNGMIENVFGVYGANLYRWHHNHGVEEYPTTHTYRTAKLLAESNLKSLILGRYWKNTYDALQMSALNQNGQGVTDIEDNYIVKDGKTEYVIVIEDSFAEEYSIAALELYNLFYEATGIKFTFVSSFGVEYTADSKFIYLGNSDLFTGLGVDLDQLGSQGFAIKTKGQSIFIIANPQGVLYGVYELLHETLGFETYTKEMYTLNKNVKNLDLPTLNITQVPDVEYRMAFSGVQYADEVSRRRMRTQNTGDVIVNGGQAHNMLDTIVPFDTYYKTNSNWFSSKTRSWDTKAKTQLCYTAGGRGSSSYNAMLQVAYDNVIALLAQDTNPNKVFMSLTQMDADGKWCACSGCQSVINTYGSNSATQILFINDLTSRVQTWIDSNQAGRKVQFLMFAYYDSIDAPTKGNLKLNDNVSVWVAPINDNYMLGVNESGNELGATLDNWKNVTNNFAVWAYNVYFTEYLVPYNTYDQIDQMIDACVASNVNYMWVQGNWNTTQNTGFDGLKGYLIAKLMWDSTLDVAELTENYFEAVYGAAASDMMTVYNAMKTELKRITNNGATSGVPSHTSWGLDYLKTQLDRLVAAIGKLDKADANYQKHYDAIVCESISIRYIYEQKRGKTYSTSAWGTFASETSRLGFTQKSEKDAL